MDSPAPTLEFSEALSNFPAPPHSFQEDFPGRSGALLLPELEDTEPFLFAEFASALGLSSASSQMLSGFASPGDFPGRFDSDFKDAWNNEQQLIAQAIAPDRREADLVWDTSIFANDPGPIERDLQAHGLGLEGLSPFRILCFRIPQDESQGIYLYITQGLAMLYGYEFWCGFAHPMPSLSWFFVRLASYDKTQAPWIRSYQIMATDTSLSLGEPRSWWKAYLPVPLFGLLNEIYQSIDHPRPPLSLLFLSRADLLYLAHFGIPEFFSYLEEHGIAWHNNIKRVIEV